MSIATVAIAGSGRSRSGWGFFLRSKKGFDPEVEVGLLAGLAPGVWRSGALRFGASVYSETSFIRLKALIIHKVLTLQNFNLCLVIII